MKKFNGVAALVILVAGLGITAVASSPVLAAKKSASAPAAKAEDNTVVDKGWTERCAPKEKDKADQKSCEVFTRLEMKTSAMRVAEVAVGFPQDDSLPKGTARGVIILPLGIMLESGATMAVDDGKPFAFKSRFCTQSGCFSFVNMDKDLLASMKKGKALNIFFKTADSHDAHLVLALTDFDKVFDKIN